MIHRRGDSVTFRVEGIPQRGVIVEKNGDTLTVVQGGVMGSNTRNGRMAMIVGGTEHRVHESAIVREVR